MKICLYISLFMLHFTAGCHLSEDEFTVTGYTGGSVLLSCVCADPHSTVQTFTWYYNDREEQNKIFQNEKFSGRLKLFNENSPTNLSLLITDLRKEDEGHYRCEIPFSHYKDIRLTIKGCELLNKTVPQEVKARPGESVVLPCYCNELQAKPEQLTWTYLNNTSTINYSTVQRSRNLNKILKENFPGNLSLLISDLTHEHQGEYRCSVGSQYVVIKLVVKGCELVKNKQKVDVTARSGESVVLPCYCNDLKDKPEQLTWTFLNNTSKTIYPTDRSQTEIDLIDLDENFPGNISLLISDLIKKHQGEYRCSIGSQYVNIKLIVEEKRHHTTPHTTSELTTKQYVAPVISVFSLLLLTVLAVMFWRCRAVRNLTNDRRVLRNAEATQPSSTQEQNIKQDATEDEVTYSAIVHGKTAVKAAPRQIVTAELSDYATLK